MPNTNCALIVRNTIMDVADEDRPFALSCRTKIASATLAMVVDHCSFTSGIDFEDETGSVDIGLAPPPYRSISPLDLSLDETAPEYASYANTGDHDALIGATFYPRYGFNWAASVGEFGTGVASVSSWKDSQSLGSWISKPDYPDGGTKGEAIRRQVTTTEESDLTIGDGWRIQTGKTSARILSPVVKIPVRNGQTGVSLYGVQHEHDGDLSVSAFVRYSTAFEPFAQTDPEVVGTMTFVEVDEGDVLSISVTHDIYAQMMIHIEAIP